MQKYYQLNILTVSKVKLLIMQNSLFSATLYYWTVIYILIGEQCFNAVAGPGGAKNRITSHAAGWFIL